MYKWPARGSKGERGGYAGAGGTGGVSSKELLQRATNMLPSVSQFPLNSSLNQCLVLKTSPGALPCHIDHQVWFFSLLNGTPKIQHRTAPLNHLDSAITLCC